MEEIDEHAAFHLEEVGIPPRDARLLVLLARHGAASTREIVAATGLRQPHVSATMARLVRRRWVAVGGVKGPGAGRPMNVYRLAKDLARILEEVRRAGEERHARSAKFLQRLGTPPRRPWAADAASDPSRTPTEGAT